MKKNTIVLFIMSIDPFQLSYLSNTTGDDNSHVNQMSKTGNITWSTGNEYGTDDGISGVGSKYEFSSFISMIGTDIEDINGNILPISHVGCVG